MDKAGGGGDGVGDAMLLKQDLRGLIVWVVMIGIVHVAWKMCPDIIYCILFTLSMSVVCTTEVTIEQAVVHLMKRSNPKISRVLSITLPPSDDDDEATKHFNGKVEEEERNDYPDLSNLIDETNGWIQSLEILADEMDCVLQRGDDLLAGDSDQPPPKRKVHFAPSTTVHWLPPAAETQEAHLLYYSEAEIDRMCARNI